MTVRSQEAGWVLADATRELQRADEREQPPLHWLTGWLTARSVRVCILLELVAVLVALGSDRVHPRLLPRYSPVSAADVMTAMWQIQAALVALAFPLLLLLIEFAKEPAIRTRPIAELLTKGSQIPAALTQGLIGIAVIGFLTAWVQGDSTVVVALVFIQVPTLALIGLCYVSIYRLLSNPQKLDERASEILQEKLKASMDAIWVIQRANTVLLEKLAQVGVQRTYAAVIDASDYVWLDLPEPGRLLDVDAAALATLIDAQPRRGPIATSNPVLSSEDAGDLRQTPKGVVVVVCGEVVGADRRFIGLKAQHFGTLGRNAAVIARIVKMERQ